MRYRRDCLRCLNLLSKNQGVFALFFLLIFLFPHKGYSQADRNLYNRGIQAAREGRTEAAFLHFNRLLNDFPDSEYMPQALFATGEYYFSIGDYYDARRNFDKLVNNYPEARLYAIAYLIKMAEEEGRKNEAGKLKEGLIGWQQVSLLFRDFKEHSYTSPLNRNYQALNFIDKIEIYIDGGLFAKISF